jgi:hypothetical protein
MLGKCTCMALHEFHPLAPSRVPLWVLHQRQCHSRLSLYSGPRAAAGAVNLTKRASWPQFGDTARQQTCKRERQREREREQEHETREGEEAKVEGLVWDCNKHTANQRCQKQRKEQEQAL